MSFFAVRQVPFLHTGSVLGYQQSSHGAESARGIRKHMSKRASGRAVVVR